jgi:hypothetical protein
LLETIIYLVQGIQDRQSCRLIVDTPVRANHRTLAAGGRRSSRQIRVGAVSFATSGDAESGEYYEEPMIIFKAGQLPAPFEVG